MYNSPNPNFYRDSTEGESPLLVECRDRLRRLETRVTKFLEAEGYGVNVAKPYCTPEGIIYIPSRACSLNEIVAAIPADATSDDVFDVMYKDQVICAVSKG